MDSKINKYCNCCRWSKHEKYISRALYNMRKEKEFCDVTLACGDEQLLAHKAILSACSPLFNSILKRHAHPHPIICIPGAKYISLQQLLDFMYLGQVPVPPSDVDSFVALADELQVQRVNKDDPEHEESESDDDKGRDKEDVLRRGDEGAPHEDGDRSNKDGGPHTSTYGTRPSVIKTNSSRPTPQLKRSHSKESQKTKHACLDTTERPAFTRDESGPKDDENPNGSNGLIGANPGGPGGQCRPRGPGRPPSLDNEYKDHVEFPSPQLGLFGDSKLTRGNRGGGSSERGNDNLFFDGAGFGVQDKFFSGPVGHGRGRGGIGGPQDFDEGFGGRGGIRGRGGHDGPFGGRGRGGFGGPGIGTSEQPYQDVTNARDKDMDVTKAQEKDKDVTNDEDQAPDVMNADNEDLDVMNAQNDEDTQSTVASQSESSIPGSSDVETVESYGDAKENIQHWKNFVTDHLEVNEDTFVCKICLKIYDRRWNAERHLKTVHFGEEKLCRQCGQFFKHFKTLAEHHQRGNCTLPSFQ